VASIDLKDAAAWVDELGEEVERAALRGLYSAALRGVQTIQTLIVPSRTPQPVDRGLFRAGWRAYLDIPHKTVSVENNEPHAVFVEHGVAGSRVRVGRQMIEALASWVARKGLASQSEARSVAWAIAKRMQARGIFWRAGAPGFRILEELVEKYLPRFIEDEVQREIGRIR
jgi:hypothetical protein